MELLRLEHITKNFGKGDGKVAALRDISLKIDEGELVAIIGKSGSVPVLANADILFCKAFLPSSEITAVSLESNDEYCFFACCILFFVLLTSISYLSS